jgi:hypothetical protein
MKKLIARINPFARIAALEREQRDQQRFNEHVVTVANALATAIDEIDVPSPALWPLYGRKKEATK